MHLLRHRRPLQAFLALGKRPELLFQGQVLLARFGRAAHTGEAMVFGGHRPIFGGIDHRVLPRDPVPPAAPEETAWDARTGPIGISCAMEVSNALRWRFEQGQSAPSRSGSREARPGSADKFTRSRKLDWRRASRVNGCSRRATARRRRAADPCRPRAGPHCRSARDRPAGSPSPAARSCGSP